jgi:hypothetical protein
MSSAEEQTKSARVDSNDDDQPQDSRRSTLYNWLLLFSLHQLINEVNPQWSSGQYDRQTPFSHNGYILCFMLEYHNRSLVDGALQEAFVDDFNEWEEEDWKIAHRSFVKALRHVLRSQGCYVASNRTAITRNMYDAAQDPDLN